MKNKIIIALLFSVFINTVKIHSQSMNNSFGDVTIPSYMAASLGKFAEHQVSHFTGTIRVGLHLYDITQGPLSLPISLNYHTAGVRVSEVASREGLNWAMYAGGMISRTVIGIADEGQYGWFSLQNLNNLNLTEIADGVRDSEPDVFVFNVAGYSGKFLFDIDAGTSQTVEPMIIPRQDIKITRIFANSTLAGFKVILPNGVVCYFGYYNGSSMVETSQPLPNANATTSGWYLMRMESHDAKHWLTFNYQTERYSYPYAASAEYYVTSQQSPCATQGSYGSRYLNFYNSAVNYNYVIGKRLTSIANSSGTQTVNFNTDGVTRQDLEVFGSSPPQRLKEIVIQNGNFGYKWELTHSYFQSPSDNWDIGNGTTSSRWYKRLKLDQIQEKALSGSPVINPYVFEYHNPNSIPHRLSYAIDHWGFANGETLNGAYPVNVPPTEVNGIYYGGSKRDSKESGMLAGSLKKVTYPTKGYTEYRFGANRIFYPAGSSAPFVSKERQTTCYVNGGQTCCTQEFATSNTFNLSATEILDAEISLDLKYGDYVTGHCNNAPNYLNFKLYTSTGTEVDSLSITQSSGIEEPPVRFDLTDEFGSIPAGDYYFTIETEYAWGEAEVFVKEAVEKDVGGLRIENIAHYCRAGTLLDSTGYSYTKAGSNESSGELYVEPVYGDQVIDNTNYIHLFWRDMAVVPLGGFDGYHIGYTRVVEKKESHGHTEYLFTVEPRVQLNTYPQVPELFLVKNGQRDNTIVKKENDAQVQSSTNTYTSAYTNLGSQSLKVFYFKHGPDPFGTTCYYIKAVLYPIRTGYNLISKEVVDRDGMQYTISHGYSINDQLAPTSQEVTNSDGDVHRTEMSYASTYSGSSTVKNKLLEQNRIVPAWKTVKKVDNVEVDGDSTLYSFFTTSGTPTTSSTTALYAHKKYRYEMSWDNSGSAVVDDWQLQSTVDKYQVNVGSPAEVTIDGWSDPLELTWKSSGKLLQWKFIDHNKIYTYYTGSDLLEEYTAIDGTTIDYTWDDFMRLETEEDCKGVTAALAYVFSNGTEENRVNTTLTYPTLGTATNKSLTTTTFYDELYSPIQTLRYQQHPSGTSQSIAEEQGYNALHWPTYRHEPKTNTGSPTNYINANTHFTRTFWESSPLQRPIKVEHPGSATLGRMLYSYGTNTATEVKDHINGGNYAANTLHKTVATDADGNETHTFVDVLGNQVLVRRKNGTSIADTYTLYDAKNRPYLILPPGTTTSSTNLIFKKVFSGDDQILVQDDPDQDPETFTYDARELVESWQDGKMAAEGRIYSFVRDSYGRATIEGFGTTAGAVTDPVILRTYGSSGIEIDKVIVESSKVTGTEFFVVREPEYDNCGRAYVTRKNSILHPQPKSIVDSLIFDDADNIVTAYYKVKPEGLEVRIRNTFDHAGRYIKSFIQVTTGSTTWPEKEMTVKKYTVKEQIEDLILGGGLQRLDYSYLHNRFLSGINSPLVDFAVGTDLFGMKIAYDSQIDAGNVTGQVLKNNGNITAVQWRQRDNAAGTVGNKKAYAYEYNFLDMLTAAEYFESGNNDAYDASFSYEDHRGNFDQITRNSPAGQIDNLTYTYKSGTNQLQTISDGSSGSTNKRGYVQNGNTYQQDENGFIKYDAENGASIIRDHLNHILEYTYGDVTIRSSRDASGVMHRRELDSAGIRTVIDKIGMFEFRNGALSVIHHGNGYITLDRPVPEELFLTGTVSHVKTEKAVKITTERVLNSPANEENKAQECIEMIAGFEVKNGAQYLADIEEFAVQGLNYIFVIRDHLGSPRVLFEDANNDGGIDFANEVMEFKAYYPFGIEYEDDPPGVSQYRQRFNDKEAISYTNYLEFEARNYIKSAAVFDGPDPISEQFPHVSTIAYAENDAAGSIDLWGLQRMEMQAGDLNWRLIKAKSGADRQKIKSENARMLEEMAPLAIGGTALITGATAFGTFGVGPTLGFVGNEVKDEMLSQATGGVSDVVDASKLITSFGKKISKQLGKRGWTEESIIDLIENSEETRSVRDTRWTGDGTKLDDPATAYIDKDGNYVIRNDKTGDVTQVSNKNSPEWKAPWEEQ